MIFRFDLFILDDGLLELKRGDEPRALEPQVFSLLVYLITNRDRVVSKDELIENIWQGRIVSDATLNTRINAARRAVDDNGKKQAVIKTFAKRGFRFVAEVVEESAGPQTAPGTATDQQVRFCTASDGTRIAYATAGEGPPLVKTANWLNHLEFDWQSPVWRPMLHEFASRYFLVRYDQRGNGLSDWEVGDLSLDAFVDDLEAVVEALGLDRFPLFGMSQGCPTAVAYAVRHPERVSHLVLYGGFASGARKRGRQFNAEQEEAVATLIREGWGQDNPAFRQIFTSQFMPDATVEQMQWFNDLQRTTTSPENAARLRVAIDEIDVADILPEVLTPTLVIHRRDDGRQPFAEGRRLAALIPDARFLALDGKNHIMLEHEAAWPRFLREINLFLET